MKGPKALLVLILAGALATLYLYNAAKNSASQGEGNGPAGPSSTGSADQQERYVEVETPSGIERLRAERITFVLLSTGRLAYDASLTVSGYLFGDSEETSISLYSADGKLEAEVGKAWTDQQGNLPSYSFGIPKDVAPGKHTVRVEGNSSGRKAEASFFLRAGNPWVNPSTYSGKPHSTVDLSGGGYLPGEAVSIHFDSLRSDPIDQVTSDSDGALTASVRVPFAGEGEHAFIIMGEKTNSPVRIPFSMLGFHPWASLSNYSPQPVQAIGFSGHDFIPGEEVRIYLNQFGPEAVAVTTSDVEGNFDLSAEYFAPPESTGENKFLLIGSLSQTVIEVEFEVLPLTPALELTAYAGLPGTPVSFIGQGFFPGETLRAYVGKPEPGKELSIFEAGEDGSFDSNGTFNIPFTGLGSTVDITLVGDRSRSPATVAFAVLPYSPWANLSAYFGPPGTAVVVDGGGFAPGEAVTLHFQNRQSPIVLRIQTGPDGSFQRTGPFEVPSTGGESTLVVLLGEKSEAQVAVEFKITSLDKVPKNEPTPPATSMPPAGEPSGSPIESEPPAEEGAGNH